MYNHQPEDYNCPLCRVVRDEQWEMYDSSSEVYRSDTVVAYINPKWWVNNSGNVMVIPAEHVENVYDISDELLADVQSVGKKIAVAMKATYECDGTSFRQHNEPAGNQAVWHYHLHIFPRYENDNLYLNHDDNRMTTPEERAPYAEKLRKALSGS